MPTPVSHLRGRRECLLALSRFYLLWLLLVFYYGYVYTFILDAAQSCPSSFNLCKQIVGVGIYRVYFHPLSKYPGPHLAKFTTLYGAYHGYKGDWSATLFDLHQKHGDYVRWNPHFLIINTAQAFEGMLTFTKPSHIYPCDN